MTSRVTRLATALVATALVAGCTADEPDATDAAAPGTTLVACVVPTPQLVEVAGGGGYEGFDIAVLEHVADALAVELEYVEVSFDELVSGVALNGMECEIGAGGVIAQEELDAVVTASTPYRRVDRAVIAVGEAEPAAPGDVTGPVGFVEGGLAADAVEELPNAELVPYPSLTDLERGVGTLELPRWLVTVAERASLGDALALDLEIVARVPSGESTVLLLPLGVDEDRLEAVDAALADLLDTGEYEALRERWLAA